MTAAAIDKVFAGSIPRFYQERIVPMIFQPYADDLARTPHGYHDVNVVARDVRAAGFGDPRIETIAARSVAPNALEPAIAYCHGTPLRSEVEARGSLDEATRVAAKAIEERFGPGPVDGKIQAHVVMVER